MIEARFVIPEGTRDIRAASNGIPALHGSIRWESRRNLGELQFAPLVSKARRAKFGTLRR
jgi:hypothetical protein